MNVSVSNADLSLNLIGNTWKKRDAALIVSYVDVLETILYLVCILWLSHKEKAAKAARTQVTAGNYTVMVTNLPKDVPQFELEKRLRCGRVSCDPVNTLGACWY